MDRKQIRVNYLYFGIFLFILLLTSGSSIFIKDALAGSRVFFFLYAAGQAIFETLVFLFLAWSLNHYVSNRISLTFIGATFLLLIFHFFDFLLERVIDMSVWETIGFVLDESWTSFIFLLDASGLPIWVWALSFSLLVLLPLLGIVLYKWTDRIAAKKPLHLRREWIFQLFVCIPFALLFWEFSASPILHPDSYTSFLKSIPWKWTFLEPSSIQYPIPASLIAPQSEAQMHKAISKDSTKLVSRPNIYLFVIESFREDCIDPMTAPNLHGFKQNGVHFDLALSNANGSHPSWFSIFHSQFSLFWKTTQNQGWKMGSPPLNLLKKWGYQIRVYSSAQLKYYGMDELLFGKDLHLTEHYQMFSHTPPMTAAMSDAQTIEKFLQDSNKNEGQLVVFFWDSTHFNYAWPKNFPAKFTPFSKETEYFSMFQSAAKIEKIKNRYRNAVHYIDTLFGKCMEHFGPNDIVIVTGDHGEEFFEHGHLFHGSHLTQEQMHIPLYMKLGNRVVENPPKIASQMDIFPTILHHLSGKEIPFLAGSSIFGNDHPPYAVISRFNAGRSPFEFCIHNGEHKLIAQFENKKEMFLSKQLKIRSLWNRKDQGLFSTNDQLDLWIQAEFGQAIEKLFSHYPY